MIGAGATVDLIGYGIFSDCPMYLSVENKDGNVDVYSIYERGALIATIYGKDDYFQWKRPHGKFGRKYPTQIAALKSIIKNEERFGPERCYNRLLKHLRNSSKPSPAG